MDLFLKVYKAEGRKLQPFEDMPQPTAREAPFYEAFRNLSFSRSYTDNGPNPISIDAILSYPSMAMMGLDWQEDIIDIMQAMDAKFLTAKRERMTAEIDKLNKGKGTVKK